ncbi:uncharacterized mitochondrial protein-like protein [Tanacetum coccineum]
MDVKSDFLYGKIEEEVYVCQPLRFEDPDFPDRVYKVEKALYGLHQAPRAWYETLSTYLLDNEFQRGKIDKTLFIKRYKGDILLVQVYQKKDGIFISQDKYVGEILKKFRFTEVKTASTPMETQKPLLKDEDGEEVDVHMYRSMIGSLMYLTSSRPDIMFAVCACARYQVNPKVSHLYAVKRIFRYLKGQPKLGLWYPKDSPFDLVAYTDSDYAGASLDRKSTIGGCQFLRCRLISWQCKKQTVVANSTTEAEYVAASSCYGQAKTVNGEVQLQALVDGKKIIITKSILTLMGYEKISQKLTFYKAFFSPQWKFLIHIVLQCLSSKTTAWNEFSSTMASAIIYKAVNEEMDDNLERTATTATDLEAERDSGKIDKTQSKATLNEPSSSGTSSGSGPMRQETMGDTISQTRCENVSKLSNDPLLARGNTLQSGEDSLKLQELMALCTTLQSRVLALKTTKTTQANEIAGLKRRVKKLERRNKSRTHRLKRLYKVGSSRRIESSRDEEDLGEEDASKQGMRIHDINADEDITLVNDDNEMFDGKRNVIKEPSVPVSVVSASTKDSAATIAATTTTATIPTLRKGIVFQEPGTTTTTTISSQQPSQENVQDKGKGKMVEPEKPMKKKELIRLDEEVALKLQAEFDEEVRLAREKAEKEQEANVALTEEWDDIQAKIEADHELAQRLQAQEQEELSDAEKATLFVQLLEKRRKHFAAKRAEEKRNKPPTQAQQRKIMCTYLKNMEGKKPKDLKNKSFDSIQKMFDRAFKRVNTFVDFRTDLVEGSSKRAGEELEQESSKKQKVDDDKETTELKSLMEVIPDEEEVALDAIPLAVKSPSIVDWKIHKEGKKSYYQIIRADGSSKMYLVFSHMLKSFDREDLETLYKLVKAKYGSTRPVEDLDLVLYGDLKTMFEPHVEDNVWKNQSDYRVLDWKLYDSCGVHSLRKQNVHIHMLVEKRYPLTAPTITYMLNRKLQADHWNEMCYQLLKLSASHCVILQLYNLIILLFNVTSVIFL